MGVDLGLVAVERREHALHRVVAQAAVGVDARAQPRHLAVAHELAADPARVDAAMSSRVELEPMSTTATFMPRRVRLPRGSGRPGRGTGCGIGSPSSAASRLSTASVAIASRAVWVAEPMCGATIRLGALSSGSSAGGGSGSVTSSAAPAISPRRRASMQRALVDDRAAGGVDQDRRGLHRPQRRRVDQVVGVGRQRAVQRDEVRALEQREQRHAAVRAGVKHGHLKARGAPRHRASDPAHADDPERRPVDVVAEVAARLPGQPVSVGDRLQRLRAAGAPPPAAG